MFGKCAVFCLMNYKLKSWVDALYFLPLCVDKYNWFAFPCTGYELFLFKFRFLFLELFVQNNGGVVKFTIQKFGLKVPRANDPLWLKLLELRFFILLTFLIFLQLPFFSWSWESTLTTINSPEIIFKLFILNKSPRWWYYV